MVEMLKGIKVIDLTNNTAGPSATMLLAERGAEVIHIEKPVYGNDNRGFAPQADGTSFWACNVLRNKKSVVLNLKDPKAIAAVKEMIKDADVFVQAFAPGVIERLGLGYDVVSELNPRIVYCSVSAFGHKGPLGKRPGFDILAQAYSGLIDSTGYPDGPGMKIGFAIADFVGGINAFASIMTALYSREHTGKGQHIDASLARPLLWMNGTFEYESTGTYRMRQGNIDSSYMPYGIFEGKNNETTVIGATNNNRWEKLCEAMNREDLIVNPKFSTNLARCENRFELTDIIEDWLKTFDCINDANSVLEACGVPCFKIMTPKELWNDPHARESGWIRDIMTPDGVTEIKTIPATIGLADFSDGDLKVGVAPDLGQHNIEVLTQYGFTVDEVKEYEERWEEEVYSRKSQ